MQEGAFVKNAADKEQVRSAGRKEREKRRQELADLRDLMALPAGRRFIWRLINEICHCDAISAVTSGSITYMNEGERNVGRLVKGDVFEAAHEAYQQMEREYMKAHLGPVEEHDAAHVNG